MRRAAVFVAVAALSLAGCSTGRTRTLDLAYTPSDRTSASGAGAGRQSVALATFVDGREKADRIGVVKADSGDTVYVARGSLAKAVTDAVARRLEADGYKVSRLDRPWDPRAGDPPEADADLVVGGVIERFYAETNGNYIWAPADAEVSLRVAVAKPSERRLLGVSLIRSNLDGTTTSGSLAANLTERFATAIDQVPLAPGLAPTLSGTGQQ